MASGPGPAAPDRKVEKLKKKGNVGKLISILGDKDPLRRTAAAAALGELADGRAVQPLIEALKDDLPSVRAEACTALAQIGDPRAFLPISVLPWNKVSNEAKDAALTAFSGVPLGLLLVGLGDSDDSVRVAAAHSLGRSGETAAVEPLIAALRDDRSVMVRCASAHALGLIPDPRSVELLIAAVAHPSYDGTCSTRDDAARSLRKIAAAIPDALVEPLRALTDEDDSDVRAFAVELLGQIGGQIPAALVKSTLRALTDEDMHVRLAAVELLGQIGDPVAVEPLLRALDDPASTGTQTDAEGCYPHRPVCEAAARALGRLRDPRAVEPLMAAYADGTRSLDMRTQIIDAVGAIGDERTADFLIQSFWADTQTPQLPGGGGTPTSVKALKTIGGLKAEEIVRLADALGKVASADQALRSQAVAELRSLGAIGVKGLVSAQREYAAADPGSGIEWGGEEWREGINRLAGIQAAIEAALQAIGEPEA
jgi:HEAT repeat protein